MREFDDRYWHAARRRIATLASLDPRRELVFASESHDYRVLDPVSEQQLANFERASANRLPHDYRAFLLHYGAGGAGPDYGIYDFHHLDRANVSLRFPLTATQDWPEDGRDPLWKRPGLLTISTSGCAIDWYLEVNGPQPGTMWVNAGPGEQLMRTESFGAWFSDWLDRVERGVHAHVVIRRLVERGAGFTEIAASIDAKSYSFHACGVDYVGFLGIPGRLQIADDRVVQLDVGTSWIE